MLTINFNTVFLDKPWFVKLIKIIENKNNIKH